MRTFTINTFGHILPKVEGIDYLPGGDKDSIPWMPWRKIGEKFHTSDVEHVVVATNYYNCEGRYVYVYAHLPLRTLLPDDRGLEQEFEPPSFREKKHIYLVSTGAHLYRDNRIDVI